MRLIDYFDAYTEAGLQIIPLFPKSKAPMWSNWHQNWDKNRCRETCLKYPFANLGLLLGEIVDVEGDSDQANVFLDDLVTNYPHPVYRSSRSVHHLFINPDPTLTGCRFNNIEFRGHKHQSVIPPSKHADGKMYYWLSKTKFPIPQMPESLLEYYRRHLSNKQPQIKPGHTRLWCSVCRQKKYIHQKRLRLEIIAFKEIGLRWQCRLCRNVDLREICRQIRRQLN